jgi:hypothetical protein
MKNRIFLIIILLLPSFAYAFDFNDCNIVEVVLGGDDRNAHVQLDCVINNVPTCATSNKYFAFDRSSESGRQKLGVLLAAHAANMKVTGTINQAEGTCPTWQSNVAYLQHIRVRK